MFTEIADFIIGFLSIISHTIDDITTTMTRKKEQLTKYNDRIEDMNLSDETLRQIYHISYIITSLTILRRKSNTY